MIVSKKKWTNTWNTPRDMSKYVDLPGINLKGLEPSFSIASLQTFAPLRRPKLLEAGEEQWRLFGDSFDTTSQQQQPTPSTQKLGWMLIINLSATKSACQFNHSPLRFGRCSSLRGPWDLRSWRITVVQIGGQRTTDFSSWEVKIVCLFTVWIFMLYITLPNILHTIHTL